MIDNPWNEFLENFVLTNTKNRKNKELIVLKNDENIHLFQSLPSKFQKLKDLVLCSNCEILVSKRNCLFHSKIHKNSFNSYLPYDAFPSDENIELHSRSKTIFNNSTTEKIFPNSKEKKRKIIKKSKQTKYGNTNKLLHYDSLPMEISAEKQISKCQDNLKFIPKTILNSSDPLKLKIRLQPKGTNENEKMRQENGNIFDNLNNYCNDMKNMNKSIKIPRIKSADDLNFDNYPKESETNECDFFVTNYDEKKFSVNEKRESFGNTIGAENILKIRRMDNVDVKGGNQWPKKISMRSMNLSGSPCLPGAIPIVAKRSFPIADKPNVNLKTSSLSSQSSAQSVQNIQSKDVIQNFGNRIIRINGQRKFVRIQQLEDNATTWQKSASEHTSVSFPNQEATQKQFQRRLIQQGMISENDIIKCTRPSSESDQLQRRKVTILNGSLSFNDPRVQLVRKNNPVQNVSTISYPRVVENPNRYLPVVQSLDQRNLVFNRVVLDKNNSLPFSQSVNHNHNHHHNHHHPKSWSCQNVSNVELSDEEFILDSEFPNSRNNSNFISSLHNTPKSQCHSSTSISEPSYHISNFKPYQNSDPEIFSHNYRQDESADPTIHFLPSPGRQIMDLPWDI